MEINNYYNFRNPIRHFLNIDNVSLVSEVHTLNIKDLCWTQPVNFRVRKDDNKYRTLKMPNILNFIYAYKHFKDYQNFLDIIGMDEHKRLMPNLTTGDFKAGIYDMQMESDFERLCIYDNLLKLDIKSYYGRIYTHYIGYENDGDELYLTNLNLGATNGLIMGNYISLYFAEKYSKNISEDIAKEIDGKIDCEFEYFSDDFYFFCNTKDNYRVVEIFDQVLEKYDLERNDKKQEIWTYEMYNNYNVSEQYWKKIISESKVRYDEEREDNKLYFVNQLIYRMSNLKDDKQKKVFINNFFKSKYFYDLDVGNYIIEDYNCHQLSYMFRFLPEVMLYTLGKFREVDYFCQERFKRFLQARYRYTLDKSYNDEQLYYYYTIKLLNYEDLLSEVVDKVIASNNQLLISYYLKDNLFNDTYLTKLKSMKDEKYWFQNYHLILFSDLKHDIENSIKEYLMPGYVKTDRQKKSYLQFYKVNLESEITLIRDIEVVCNIINEYLESKINERVEIWGEDMEV